jgi:hypothetical protein
MIKTAFVGNPATQCLGSCAGQTSSSPNGNPGVDALASVLVHELVEAVSDPQVQCVASCELLSVCELRVARCEM